MAPNDCRRGGIGSYKCSQNIVAQCQKCGEKGQLKPILPLMLKSSHIGPNQIKIPHFVKSVKSVRKYQ